MPWLKKIPQKTTFKTRHVLQYGGMASFIYLFLRSLVPWSLCKISTLAVSMATLIGALSEWIQSFVPGRIPSLYDAWFDFLGAVIGLGICICLDKVFFYNQRKL